MNTAITKEEQTTRRFKIVFDTNMDYLEFIAVLATISELKRSKIAYDLFNDEYEIIMQDPKLSKIYQDIRALMD